MVEPDNSMSQIRSNSRKRLTLPLQLADAVRRHDGRFDEIDRRFNEVAMSLSLDAGWGIPTCQGERAR